MIRRELPLTTHASPANGLAQKEGRGFSFVLAPTAADLVLELDYVIQGICFSLVGKVLLLGFHAAIGCRQACSAFRPKAQMNPSSSRPIATITFRWSLPAIVNLL